jgi:hypothetical protein
MNPRSFYDTAGCDAPMVYGIAPMDGGDVVYIGATKRPAQRMDAYRNTKRCHNVLLAEWLDETDAGFIVLYQGDDYKAKERNLIRAHDGALFNLASGGEQSWRRHRKKPWMAKTGIHCPSDAALRLLRLGKHDKSAAELRGRREAMTDVDRCLFELETARRLMWHRSLAASFMGWAEYALNPVIATIEGGGISPLRLDAS